MISVPGSSNNSLEENYSRQNTDNVLKGLQRKQTQQKDLCELNGKNEQSLL